jgi:hypothetical protein
VRLLAAARLPPVEPRYIKREGWSEPGVGLLVLIGGRMAQLGMVAILGMQACLLLFGWILTIFGIFMLVAVGLLLRAQIRHERTPLMTGRIPATPRRAARTGPSR